MTSVAPTRRSLVQGLGAAFALMFGSGVANAQSRVRFQPPRHQLTTVSLCLISGPPFRIW